MATYYVNEVRNELVEILADVSGYGENVVGLFDKENWCGYGNFCGWYGTECYSDTNLLAFYRACYSGAVNFTERVGDVVVLDDPIHYDEVPIGSCYWTKKIEANSVEEAIEKFKAMDWTR